MRDVQAPIIPVIAELIRSNPGTISLGQGVVAYGPPPAALRALADFPASPSDHQYGPVEGLPALVDGLAAKLERENGIQVGTESRIVVTAGGNMAFMNAVLATTDPGDEVILQAPYYFNHDMAIAMAGCRSIPVATDFDFQLRPDAIRRAITSRTRAVVTISPNNPTGAVYSEASLREVNDICRQSGICHIHDEAYEYFTYGGVRHFSPRAIDGSSAFTIPLYSFSKAYGMAGARVGYMVVPAHLFRAINKIQDTILICPAIASQRMALASLGVGPEYCRTRVTELAGVRDEMLRSLAELAPRCAVRRPDGAFYCLVKIRATMDPLALVEQLIRRFKVAVVPGTAFGLTDGCYLRVSYGALERKTIEEGLSRLVQGLRTLVPDAA